VTCEHGAWAKEAVPVHAQFCAIGFASRCTCEPEDLEMCAECYQALCDANDAKRAHRNRSDATRRNWADRSKTKAWRLNMRKSALARWAKRKAQS
jgi:hypothetical protein